MASDCFWCGFYGYRDLFAYPVAICQNVSLVTNLLRCISMLNIARSRGHDVSLPNTFFFGGGGECGCLCLNIARLSGHDVSLPSHYYIWGVKVHEPQVNTKCGCGTRYDKLKHINN